MLQPELTFQWHSIRDRPRFEPRPRDTRGWRRPLTQRKSNTLLSDATLTKRGLLIARTFTDAGQSGLGI